MKPQTTFSNYHCHTSFSDGKETPEEVVKQAVSLGIKTIGISEHTPLPFYTFWNMPASRMEEYIQCIQQLKLKYANKIEVYQSLEIDYIEECIDDILKIAQSSRLDYTIGSIHFLGRKANGEFWNTDGDPEEFEQGADQVFAYNGSRMIEAYFSAVCKLVDTIKPTIIGHIDKFRMHNINNQYFDENATYYKDAAMQALRAAKKADCIIEFNTRGLYKHPNRMPYPSKWMLKEMNKLDIKVTVNSDSHSPEELINEFDAAFELLKNAGYKTHMQLIENKWIEKHII